MKRADLHIHTTASDGGFTVRQVFQEAEKLGLSAIAITDHDSVEALPAAADISAGGIVELVPGIELSVALEYGELHLLGYYLDYTDPELLESLARFQKVRSRRADRILKKMEEMGYPLDMEELLPGQMTGSIGRLHIAQGLVRAGYVRTIPEAFRRLLGDGGPAYVSKIKLSLKDAMDMILRVGGVPVLAHPGQLDRDELIPELVKIGLAGLEAYYPSHSRFAINHYEELARHYGLIATGGSDCHGTNKDRILMGTVTVPCKVVEELKAKAKE